MTTLPSYLKSLDYLPLNNTFIPSETPSNKLMILLHGRGGKAEDFTWIPDFLNFDDMHYLFLNAPNTYGDGYSWYDDSLNGTDEVFTLLEQTFDMLFQKDFDADKSFLFGFSQGALLTFEFGARYEHKLAGYIAISGHINKPKLLLEEMNHQIKDANWLCIHGIEDEALDFKIAKEQIRILQKGGINIIFKAYHKTHSIEKEEMKMIKAWIKSKF